MTKPIRASEVGLDPHYKVRIIFHGSVVHVASRVRPDRIDGEWVLAVIDDPNYGDSVGFIDWSAVKAITWRFSP